MTGRRLAGRLALALAVLASGALWAIAQICPVCGKRSCPWYAARTRAAAPAELIAQIRKELLEADPEFQRAKREGRLDRMMLRLGELRESEAFKAGVNARLAREPAYNRYRIERLEEAVRPAPAPTYRGLPALPEETRKAVERVLDRDPALAGYTGLQRRLILESPDVGELLLAVGAGKLAVGSRREASKLIAATPFDDGAAGGAVVAARELRQDVDAAIAKEGEAVTRFTAVREAAPTAAERAELAAPGSGKREAEEALLRQSALGGSAHAEARERVKGLVIAAPPAPLVDRPPETAAQATRAWGVKAAEAVRAWTTHIHDVYPAGSR